MLYREIIAVCSQIHTKHTNKLCGLIELVHIYIYIYIYIYTHTHTHTYTYIHTHYVCVCVCVYIYIYTHTHTYINTYIHTHTMCVCVSMWFKRRKRENNERHSSVLTCCTQWQRFGSLYGDRTFITITINSPSLIS
jgi:hypothetical protein